MKPWALLSVTMLLVLATPAFAAPDPVAAARATIDKANADWLPAMKAKDAQRIAADYAPDGVLLLPDGRTVIGPAAIADFYRARLASITVQTGGLHSDGAATEDGGLVFEWGHGGSTSMDAAGHSSTRSGPYLTVWRQDAEGHWRIIRNLVF
jgi:uncharacterized protein (TIGR02246 family)